MSSHDGILGVLVFWLARFCLRLSSFGNTARYYARNFPARRWCFPLARVLPWNLQHIVRDGRSTLAGDEANLGNPEVYFQYASRFRRPSLFVSRYARKRLFCAVR